MPKPSEANCPLYEPITVASFVLWSSVLHSPSKSSGFSRSADNRPNSRERKTNVLASNGCMSHRLHSRWVRQGEHSPSCRPAQSVVIADYPLCLGLPSVTSPPDILWYKSAGWVIQIDCPSPPIANKRLQTPCIYRQADGASAPRPCWGCCLYSPDRSGAKRPSTRG